MVHPTPSPLPHLDPHLRIGLLRVARDENSIYRDPSLRKNISPDFADFPRIGGEAIVEGCGLADVNCDVQRDWDLHNSVTAAIVVVVLIVLIAILGTGSFPTVHMSEMTREIRPRETFNTGREPRPSPNEPPRGAVLLPPLEFIRIERRNVVKIVEA